MSGNIESFEYSQYIDPTKKSNNNIFKENSVVATLYLYFYQREKTFQIFNTFY